VIFESGARTPKTWREFAKRGVDIFGAATCCFCSRQCRVIRVVVSLDYRGQIIFVRSDPSSDCGKTFRL